MLLNLEKVRKNRGDGYGLEIPSLGVARGECLAITGPSGCGKSTTLDIIGMALEPDEAARFEFSPGGKAFSIAELWKKDDQSALATLRLKYTGYILQTGEIFNFLNVRENIELTALASGRGKQFASRKACELLERLEISNLAGQMPATLSIGQRQRVAIARALAPEPVMILADEPTSALDPLMARQVMGLMLEAVASCGATLIMVSHDPGLLSDFSLRQAQFKIARQDNGMLAILDSP